MLIGHRYIVLGLLVYIACGCASPPVSRDDESAREPTPTVEPFVEEIVAPTPTETPTPTAPPPVTPTPTPIPMTGESRRDLLDVFMRGSLLERQGQYDEAGKVYTQGLRIAPESDYLRMLASEAFLQAGRLDEALRVASEIETEGAGADLFRLLARIHQFRGDWPRAEATMEKAVELDPRSIESRYELANIYLRTNKIEQAVHQFQELARIDPIREPEYRLQAAMRLMALDRPAEALAEYERLAELLSDYYEIHIRIGDLYGLMGDADKAIDSYLNALGAIEHPLQEIDVRQRLAILYNQRGSTQEALHQYQRIRELDPANVDARRYLGQAYLEMGDYEAALVELELLIEQQPGNFRLRLLSRTLLDRLDRREEGFRDYLEGFAAALERGARHELDLFIQEAGQQTTLRALDNFGLLPQLTQLLAEVETRQPDLRSALFAQVKLALAQDDAPRLRERLRAILARLREAVAEENRLEILAQCRLLQGWFRVRLEFESAGMWAELTSLLENASRAFPDQAQILRTLGMAYMDRYEWSEAESRFRQALALTDESTSAYRDLQFQLAAVHERLNRISEVERIMRAMIARDPQDASAHNFLGYTFADHDMNLEEALELIQTALRHNPHDGNIIDSLGWVYYRMGRYHDAIRELNRAAAIERNHPVILDHLGDAYYRIGDAEQALMHWRNALEAGPNHPYEFTPEFRFEVQTKIREAERKESQ